MILLTRFRFWRSWILPVNSASTVNASHPVMIVAVRRHKQATLELLLSWVWLEVSVWWCLACMHVGLMLPAKLPYVSQHVIFASILMCGRLQHPVGDQPSISKAVQQITMCMHTCIPTLASGLVA